MSDHFKTEAAADDFCSGLQRRFIRAMALPPSDDRGTWQVISPDLDFRREHRVWGSAAEALAVRVGAEIPEESLPLAKATDPVVDELYTPEPDQVLIRLPEEDS